MNKNQKTLVANFFKENPEVKVVFISIDNNIFTNESNAKMHKVKYEPAYNPKIAKKDEEANQELQEKIDTLEEENSEKDSQIASLTLQVNQMTTDNSNLIREKEELSKKLNEALSNPDSKRMQEDLKNLQGQLDKAKADLKSMRTENTNLKKKVNANK